MDRRRARLVGRARALHGDRLGAARAVISELAALIRRVRASYEHPTLDVLADPDDPHTLVAARHVVVAVRGLRAALRAYRAAIRRPTAAPLYDDVPF